MSAIMAKETQPLVSVITVCRNSERTIRDTIESVLFQTYDCVEYILIDGASNDRTVEIIRSYKEAFSTKGIPYRWISEPDRGIYDAMNKGIDLSIGELIGILNSDDWYCIDTIAAAVSCRNKAPDVSIFHGNLIFHGTSGQIKQFLPKVSMTRMIWFGMSCFHPTFFVDKNVYERFQFDVTYRVLADYKFAMETMSAGYQYQYNSDIVSNMRTGGASSVFLLRIKEGHRARKELGIGIPIVWASTIVRVLVGAASKFKRAVRCVGLG